MLRILAGALLASFIAAPVAAADRSTTHEAISMPPGKLQFIAFRPLKANACAPAPVNPSGSRIEAVRPADGACDEQRSYRRAAHK